MPMQPCQPTPLFEKSNVLVIGPTGSGKTLLAKTLAKVLDVPFSVSDATSFTQAGYVGDDVDMCIQRLLQAANWDPYRASMGIVYIDEIDKIARKVGSGGIEGTRDVGGEGVQQALLRMIEGTTVTVQAKGSPVMAPPVGGEGRSRAGQRSLNVGGPRPDAYSIDTTNVLFVLSGAFVGLENIIKRRVVKGSIGFTADLSSPSQEGAGNSMPFFTPNKRSMPSFLDHVEPEGTNLLSRQVRVDEGNMPTFIRFDQIWFHPRVHFSNALFNNLITVDPVRSSTSSHRSQRFSHFTVHCSLWVFWHRDQVYHCSVRRNLPKSC
ncbi:hypothetical protein AcW2_006269 [Taiwanofungus camphoratus]|nr:hypothetical protein AcW2_006269 [Antrodia cinnamomea]